MENITAKDLTNIREKISQELQMQLSVDGIKVTQEQINWLLEEIRFHFTDGDRSALEHMNQIMFILECHLDGDFYHSLAQINAYLNTVYSAWTGLPNTPTLPNRGRKWKKF